MKDEIFNPLGIEPKDTNFMRMIKAVMFAKGLENSTQLAQYFGIADCIGIAWLSGKQLPTYQELQLIKDNNFFE